VIKIINIALGLVLAVNIYLLVKSDEVPAVSIDDKITRELRTHQADKSKRGGEGIVQGWAQVDPIANGAKELVADSGRTKPASVMRRKAIIPYLPLLRKLNPSPESRVRIIQLLIEKLNTDQEIKASLLERGMPLETTLGSWDIFLKLSRESDAELEKLLGANNYEKMMQVPAYTHFRKIIDSSVALDLQDAGVPLNTAQLEQVPSRLAVTTSRDFR